MITHEGFIKLCARKVAMEENKRNQDKGEKEIDRVDVFCVWSCKTLQNSKCLLSTAQKGAYYYEFTMNGDKGEIYMDAYSKAFHKTIDLKGDTVVQIIK